MRSQFFGNLDQGQQLPGHFALQNSKMLRVHLNGDVLARQGSMVAFQGQMDFDYEGSGGIGRFMKKALTGEGVPLMRVHGQACCSSRTTPTTSTCSTWRTRPHRQRQEHPRLRLDPAVRHPARPGRGHRRLRPVQHHPAGHRLGGAHHARHARHARLRPRPHVRRRPVRGGVEHQPPGRRQPHLQGRALIGRGSGEAMQLAYQGQGFVLIQASEGPTVAPHTH